jgi:ribosome recycling factor
MAEEGKVSVRNNRRDFVENLKAAEKDKFIDKDTSKFYQVDVHIYTHTHAAIGLFPLL